MKRHGRALASLLGMALVPALSLTACGSSKVAATTTTTTTTATPADRLIQAGVTAEAKGNTAAAIADYQAALKANPLSDIAYYDLGVIYQQKNDATDARTDYQKALLITPNYKSALFNLAILDTSSVPATAVSLYQQLLVINANDANVLFNLGLLLRRTGHTAEGDTDVAKAIRLAPTLSSRVPTTTTAPRQATTTTTTAK